MDPENYFGLLPPQSLVYRANFRKVLLKRFGPDGDHHAGRAWYDSSLKGGLAGAAGAGVENTTLWAAELVGG
eukprot:gene43860-29005_t